MTKQYIPNAFLKIVDSQVHAIFAWSQRPGEIIPYSSWLTILEIFVHEHDIESAYQIFEQVRIRSKTTPISVEITTQLDKYQPLASSAVIFLSDQSLTLFGKGFRSFIEKEEEYELVDLSRNHYQVLNHFFAATNLIDDLDQIDDIDGFCQLVIVLEKIGLLSVATNSINWGDLKKTVPICQVFGLTRGKPVDRYYLNKFITEVKSQISGQILEIGGTPKDKDFYEVNLGSSYKVMNIEAGSGIDIVGDAHDVSLIKRESFDSIITFNVLEHCYSPWQVVENIYTWLKPGGKCFAMVPSAVRLHATPMDYWRPLPDAFTWMFRNFSQRKLYVYGNLISVIASYHGIATEELTTEELDAFHPDFPVVTCIVAQK